MKALLIYPTHKNCVEALEPYLDRGVNAAAYPPRVTTDGSEFPRNCWNKDADIAEQFGFSVTKSVCPGCGHRSDCQRSGYLSQVRDADQAQIVLCTHQRAAFSGLLELSSKRDYVSIHEHPIDILRPRVMATEGDLLQVQLVLNRMLNDPQFLDWFGEAARLDEMGNRYVAEELQIRKERQLEFTRFLSRVVDRLVDAVRDAKQTVKWISAEVRMLPAGMERTLFFATRLNGATFSGRPWPFLLAAATGELFSAAIIVRRPFGKGGAQDPQFFKKVLVGFRNNGPHPKCVNWFNDATISSDRLQTVLGIPVMNRTPNGQVELQRKAVQIPRDITAGMSAKAFLNILRGVLLQRPELLNVGIICHRIHVQAIKSFELELPGRIVKTAYFRGGDDRSSNDWHGKCDLIVVAGTPRLPPGAVAEYLMQIGEVGASCREPKWGQIRWDGYTESGEPTTVKALGYHDPVWQRAQRDLVRAALVQAVGRGRGILESGCEVLVLSTEECGLPISDIELATVTGTCLQVQAAVHDLSLTNANRSLIGKGSVSTSEIADECRLSVSQARKILNVLEQLGRVSKVGERGGWKPVLQSADVQTRYFPTHPLAQPAQTHLIDSPDGPE